MKLNRSALFLLLSSCLKMISAADDVPHISMIGNANLEHIPNMEKLQKFLKNNDTEADGKRYLRKNKKGKKGKKGRTSKNSCDPSTVDLSDYDQWKAEKGYWIGDYTFLNREGTPNVSESWPYPYDAYKGFITGEISGNSYRQRNVFVYPPQDVDKCLSNPKVVGTTGICGENGNTKVFKADQSASTCEDGTISGPFQGLSTKTTLVGDDNALLYQVFVPAEFGGIPYITEDRLFQSQLTTITEDPTTGQIYRTRTAQGFNDAFLPVGFAETTYASYYREKKVTKEKFYEELNNSIDSSKIQPGDLCKWDGNGNALMDVGSLESCVSHLEEAFDI